MTRGPEFMKILVVADVHSNWPALSAIQETFDACLVLGDLVDYGTDPVPCIDWVQRHATCAIRGNHDHAVAQRVPARQGPGLRNLAAATRPLHWQLLSGRHIKYLARLPIMQSVQIGDLKLLLVHATPRDPLDEYLLMDRAGWQSRLTGVEADIVCVGHTHVQFQLALDGIEVLNPGSVGQPRDGNPQCAYAVIHDGRVELRRVEYDIDATLRHMRESGVAPQPLEMAESILRSGGRYATPPDLAAVTAE